MNVPMKSCSHLPLPLWDALFCFFSVLVDFILKKKKKMEKKWGGSPYKIHYLEMHGRVWLTLEFSIVCKAGLCTLLCLFSLTEPCSGHSSTFPGLKVEKTKSFQFQAEMEPIAVVIEYVVSGGS